jgi:hypothetical protein
MFMTGFHRMHPGLLRSDATETAPRPEAGRFRAAPAVAESPRPATLRPPAAPVQHRVQSRADTIAR